ncbi:MAG: RDD family protein, partial [Pseudonocardiaceae bacterium]
LVVFAWTLYNRYLEGQTGQSTGRRLAGTRLVRASDGRPIGPALAIVRHFVHVLDLSSAECRQIGLVADPFVLVTGLGRSPDSRTL